MAEITIRISDKVLKIAGILLCLGVLFWALAGLLPPRLFIPTYQLRLYVPEVWGLSVHAPVRLDGVDVGSVSAIRLAATSANPQRRIELVLRVYTADQDAIRSDSSASLETEGLLGNRYVNIRRGIGGTVIKPGEEIPALPTEVLTLEDSLSLLEKTIDCVNQVKKSHDVKTQAPNAPAPKSSASNSSR